MKTTIDIAADLLLRAKAAAEKQGTTLKALTEEGLRMALDRRENFSQLQPIEPFVVTGSGRAPNLGWDHLREILYGTDDGEMRR